jgi:hypothetical protein
VALPVVTSLTTAVPDLQELEVFSRLYETNGLEVDPASSHGLIARAPIDIIAVYYKASCKGQKLLAATTFLHNVAGAHISPVDSPWTCTIQQDLQTWGYRIDTDDETPE